MTEAEWLRSNDSQRLFQVVDLHVFGSDRVVIFTNCSLPFVPPVGAVEVGAEVW